MLVIKLVGFGAVSYGSSSDLKNLQVRLIGYPGDINYGFSTKAKYQYESIGNITSVSNNYFKYNAFSCQGFSGGPIMRTSDNYIVGVHIGKQNGSTPIGVRITPNMVNIINNLNN